VGDAEAKMLELRARYQELLERAAERGIQLLGVDLAGVDCSTGTSCCAGDGRVLDTRELATLPGGLLRAEAQVKGGSTDA
jgi:hypothetical protein